MRKIVHYTFAIVFSSFFIFFSCNKKKDTPIINNNNSNNNGDNSADSLLADSLKRTCINVFVGDGDSSNIYLPTAFTPNGDGINDVYRVIGSYLNFKTYLMSIYDTTGKLVFQSHDATYYWTGKDSTSGKLATQYKFYHCQPTKYFLC